MMQASRTARLVAAYRGRAELDPWGSRLAGDDGAQLARRYDEFFPPMQRWVTLRTATFDEQVRFHVARRGVTQIVVLGAGLDTRAARLARPGVRFFEVDHPASQADKRDRLAQAGDYPVDAATYVACDLSCEDFVDALLADGFEPEVPALFLWEGVTYYLDDAAVRATLARISKRAHPRSVVVFDYIRSKLAEGRARSDSAKGSRDLVGEIGEPIIWGTDDPLPMLVDAGFRHVRTASFDQLCLALTGTYERSNEFASQYIAAATKEYQGCRTVLF